MTHCPNCRSEMRTTNRTDAEDADYACTDCGRLWSEDDSGQLERVLAGTDATDGR